MLFVACVAALTFGTQQAASAATIGPEHQPIVLGAYDPNVTIQGVHAPLSYPYQWLDRGQTWSFGNVDLVFQTNGDVGIYSHSNHSKVYWRTNTAGSGATQLLFQHDGNLVLYTAGYQHHVWDSGTENECGGGQPALSLQADSNLVIYCQSPDRNQIASIWSTRTSNAT